MTRRNFPWPAVADPEDSVLRDQVSASLLHSRQQTPLLTVPVADLVQTVRPSPGMPAMKTTALLAATLALLTACSIHTHPRQIIIDPVQDHDHHAREGGPGHGHGHQGDFCPPGQAKKGRC